MRSLCVATLIHFRDPRAIPLYSFVIRPGTYSRIFFSNVSSYPKLYNHQPEYRPCQWATVTATDRQPEKKFRSNCILVALNDILCRRKIRFLLWKLQKLSINNIPLAATPAHYSPEIKSIHKEGLRCFALRGGIFKFWSLERGTIFCLQTKIARQCKIHSICNSGGPFESI